MSIIKHVVLTLCLSISPALIMAQLPVPVDPVIVEQAEQVELANLKADSLKSVWATMWRMSDSLRIQAMLMRMRSDSIRRSIGSADTIPNSIRVLARTRLAEKKLATAKAKQGQTFSDSVTWENVAIDPDTGIASYYASEFHGKKTSSGETYDMNKLTCAHRWLPFGTTLSVTNLDNGKEVVVRVNDRGPFKHGRIIDVSKRAATDLGMIGKGTTRVAVRVVN